MLRKLLLCFSFFFILQTINVNAQVEDSLETEDEEYFDDDEGWDWNWDWEENWWRWEKGKPTIEISYGLSETKHDKFKSSFAKVGFAEIKLGYASMDNDDGIVNEFNEKYGFISRLATSLHSDKAKGSELSSDLIRFGFGRRSGYCYDFGQFRILPYTENSAVWSKLEMKDYPVGITYNSNDAVNDTEILQRFDKEFRFGTSAEGGIRFELGHLISFNAGYETAVIFPRHMFWKHLGSFAIEAAGLNVIDNFVDEVFDSSPAATPIVNFLLKNGFSYAFYTLKKENMNWPFKTESPLTYETFKFGVTFTF